MPNVITTGRVSPGIATQVSFKQSIESLELVELENVQSEPSENSNVIVSGGWANAGYAIGSDNLRASSSSTFTSDATVPLILQSWGFEIPENATNLAPVVYIEGYASHTDSQWRASHYTFPSPGVLSFTKSVTAPTSSIGIDPDTEVSIGNFTFFLNRNTPANFNNPGYELRVVGVGDSGVATNFYVDNIEMEIFYQLPDPKPGSHNMNFI